MRSAYKILVGIPQGKGPHRRCWCRLGGNIEWILEK